MPIASKQRMREEQRYMFNHPDEGFAYYNTLAEASQAAQEALTADDSIIIIYEVRRIVERKPITYAQLDFAWPKERA